MPESDKPAVRQFVTRLASLEEQVGGHVLRCLQESETVAVVSTLAPGIAADQVVSIPLTREQLGRVQAVLSEVLAERPRVGFHEPEEGEE